MLASCLFMAKKHGIKISADAPKAKCLFVQRAEPAFLGIKKYYQINNKLY